jgi:hypothetical protein
LLLEKYLASTRLYNSVPKILPSLQPNFETLSLRAALFYKPLPAEDEMPDPLKPHISDTFDPKKPILHLEKRGISDSIDPKKTVPHVVTMQLAWSVVDLFNNTVIPAPDGGHFKSVKGHKYDIRATATDPHGVEKMTLSGTGSFTVASDVDDAPQIEHVQGSVASEEFTNENILAPTSHMLKVVMHPDIGGFDYDQISVGMKKIGAMKQPAEFFAVSGTMTFTATATAKRFGDVLTITLGTAP